MSNRFKERHGEKNEHMPLSGEILLYETQDGNAQDECRFIDESLCLSQGLIAELFGVSVKNSQRAFGKHL